MGILRTQPVYDLDAVGMLVVEWQEREPPGPQQYSVQPESQTPQSLSDSAATFRCPIGGRCLAHQENFLLSQLVEINDGGDVWWACPRCWESYFEKYFVKEAKAERCTLCSELAEKICAMCKLGTCEGHMEKGSRVCVFCASAKCGEDAWM